MEARFKVFLTMQIILTNFEKKRRCSCYKEILQLPLVTVKLLQYQNLYFFQTFALNSIQALHTLVRD